MNKFSRLVWESARRGFLMFFVPLTGAARGIVRGIRDEYRSIDQDYRNRLNKR